MDSLYFHHEFTGPVVEHDVGSRRYRFSVIFLPPDLARALPLDRFPRLRISGEVNDLPIEASLTPTGGRWYVLLSKARMRAIDARLGDVVTLRFRIADQAAVELPPLLEQALQGDGDVMERWNLLTAGKQRALAYRVASAKRSQTQAKRVDEVFAILRGERELRTKPRR